MSDSSDDGSPNESFFGLIVKPNKRYDTVVKKAFRISKACVEPATMEGDKVTSLYLEYDGDEFIIANLYKGQMSENLDLSFNLNEKISFKVDGPGIVHLTGNTIEEDMAPGLMDDFSDEEMEEMESEDEEVETPEPKQKKRKNEANKKDAKKIKLDSTATSNGKADDEESSDDDDDSSDETGADTTTLSELDSTTNFAEEEDSDESDDDSEEGEEEEEEGSDDDSEEESEAEEESPTKPAKTNGDVSPSKKAKLEAKAKAESPKKDVEMTPKNKKEGKPDKTPKQESKTPKAEVKTPKAEAKTPKQDGKTPKQDGKTPKPESKTPKQESKTPKQESKTPKQESKTPKQEGKTPKTPKPENKLLKEQGAATPKSAKKFSVGGVTIEDLRVGTGPDVKKGKMVGMYYAGRLQSNNKQFDACQTGKPFKFRLGAGEVIKGWDTGIMGMKVGGKRRLTIPAPLAYGSKGAPPDIPPNATLVFEIECKFCN